MFQQGQQGRQPTQVSQSKECCKRQGVSKLCLQLCEKASGRPGSLSRNLRCSAYKKQMETCMKENDANLGEYMHHYIDINSVPIK